MRTLLWIPSLFALASCTSMGGVMTAETTWFQDWSCERQDGVCARTDTIDAITITEIDGDPAEAGPVSGYPVEQLPLSATPKKLDGITLPDSDYFDHEIERGRPFLERGFGDEQVLAAPAMLSQPPMDPFVIDAVFESDSAPQEVDPFRQAFPEAAVSAQFAALGEKLGLDAGPEPISKVLASTESALEPSRLTRTVIVRDGIPVPEHEQVTELVAQNVPEEQIAGVSSSSEFEMELVAATDDPAVLSPSPEPKNKTPRRTDGKVLPVIISPYVDARGVYHERSVIWVEVEPADWVMD